jgi:MoxR-like ATPase
MMRNMIRRGIRVGSEADTEGLSADDLLGRILDHIPVP